MKPQLAKEDFFQRVYDVVRKIPRGKITSYGAIGKYLGLTSSARIVGWAMNKSHGSKLPVPAHRVVNRNGLLTGKHHFDTPNLMQELLENEGVVVINDQIQQFDLMFWDPIKEL